MKKMCKRLLGCLLVCLLLTGVVSIGAAAQTPVPQAVWAKTEVNYWLPYVGEDISKKLVSRTMERVAPLLPELLGDSLNLTGDMFNDAYLNSFLQTIPTLNPAAVYLRPKTLYTKYCPDMSDALKAEVAALASTDTFAAVNFNWGIVAGDRESFVKTFALAMRPIMALLLRGSIQTEWTQYYIPALRALGTPEANIATQAQIDDWYATLQNADPAGDGLFIAVVDPILALVDTIQSDPLGTLLRILPNLAYNLEAVKRLATETSVLSLGRLLLGAVDLADGDFIAFLETKLGEGLAGAGIETLPPIDWDKVAHAGDIDLATNQVIADEPLMQALLVNYLRRVWDGNQTSVTATLLPGLGVPAFLSPVAFQLVKALLWLLLL
ncbi:MAG: hypothetical protein LBS96_06470 [Oscillospiraceae bacterium]|jgi:hypothetical protein|nr:hypothetical protein [Oscillospiraceae bacterium]